MKSYVQCLIIVVFCGLSVSMSWSASLPPVELSRLASGDFQLEAKRIYQLLPENEEKRIITGTGIPSSDELFSVALNSESAPVQMQFYESDGSGELIIDLSGMAELTPLTIQKTEWTHPQSGVSSEQIKIRSEYKGQVHEFIILGDAGALPNLKLTRHSPEQHSTANTVVRVEQWFHPRHLQERAVDDEPARMNITGSDSNSQDDHNYGVTVAVSIAIVAGVGQLLWVLGNIRLPKDAPIVWEPPLMAMRLFSYILGFGIPLLQEFLIRTIYFKVKGKTMDMYWIPACGS